VAYTRALGGVEARTIDLSAIEKNDFFCPDVIAAVAMEEKIQQARAAGDTLGGIVEIIVRGCPPGLGEPVFDRMDADLAKALMSVGTVKGVEIGAGFAAARMTGSQCNDPIGPGGFVSNHAGGVLAGITTGAHIVARVACKPIPSIEAEQYTVDIHGRPTVVSVGGRHDRSVIPRIIPVVEAMTAITIADHLLRQKALSLSADNRL
ncbi:MAG: chorismate synthase, partial [Deltaproteobacteria bacterium]|nr:chorismate synthase [Deltaproteobacteria bacterium]